MSFWNPGERGGRTNLLADSPKQSISLRENESGLDKESPREEKKYKAQGRKKGGLNSAPLEKRASIVRTC